MEKCRKTKEKPLVDGGDVFLYSIDISNPSAAHTFQFSMEGFQLSQPIQLLKSCDQRKPTEKNILIADRTHVLNVRAEIIRHDNIGLLDTHPGNSSSMSRGALGFFEITLYAKLWLVYGTGIGLAFGSANHCVLPGQTLELTESVYENQRWYPFKQGWSSKLVPTERQPAWSDKSGRVRRALRGHHQVELPAAGWRW